MSSPRLWIARILLAAVASMAIAAGSALWVTVQTTRALSTPDQHSDLWYVSNVSSELGRVGSLAQKAMTEKSASDALRVRLDVLYSLVYQGSSVPKVRTLLVERLPETRQTLRTLAERVQLWTDALSSKEKIQRSTLQSISQDIEHLQPSLRKAVADVHLAATHQLDVERSSLRQRYTLLSWIFCGLLLGTVALVWRLVSDARIATRLSAELAELNKRLETRIEERTRQLSEERALLMFILDASPIDVALLNSADSRLIFMNSRLLERLGMEKPPRNMSLHALLEDADSARKLANALDQNGSIDQLEAKISATEPYWSCLSARLIKVDGKTVQLIWGIDISAHKALEIQLRALATMDPLSELDNRRTFFEKGDRLLQYCHRYGRACAALIVDIDHFKLVNDQHGHYVGDDAIRTVGRALRGTTRDGDIVGRIGGEEFSVLLPEASMQAALEAAERIRSTIERVRVDGEGGQSIAITVSIGVSIVTPATESLKQLLAAAEDALYRAKDAGRNRVLLEEQNLAEPQGTTNALAIV